LPPFLLCRCDTCTSLIIFCVLNGLQVRSIFIYGFYSYPLLEFRVKPYQPVKRNQGHFDSNQMEELFDIGPVLIANWWRGLDAPHSAVPDYPAWT